MSFNRTNDFSREFWGVVCVLLLSANFNTVFADTEYASDKKQLAMLMEAPCSFSGEFEQTVMPRNSTKGEVSKGSLFFDCRHGLILKTVSVETNSLVLNTQALNTQILTLDSINFLLDEKNNIQTLNGIAESLQAKLIISILSADQTFINNHFDISIDSESILRFTPITKTYNRGLENITLSRSGPDQAHVLITILDKRGQETSMIMTQSTDYSSSQQAFTACNEIYSEADYCEILNKPKQHRN